MALAVHSQQNLVFSSVGDRSRHSLWVEEPNRNFDLFLFYYGTQDADFSADGELAIKRIGTKAENLCYFFRNHQELIASYHNIFIVDGEIVIDTAMLNRMFNLFDAYSLWLAHPAFTANSKINHLITKQDSLAILRYTNCVDAGATLLKSACIIEVIAAMEQSRSGFGFDWVLSQLFGNPTDKIAILGSTPCTHPFRNKPEMDQVMKRESMEAEGTQLHARYRKVDSFQPVIFGVAPQT